MRARMRLLTRTSLSLLFLGVAGIGQASWLGPWGNPVAPSILGRAVARARAVPGGSMLAHQGAPVPGGDAIRVQRVLGDGSIAPGWPAEGVVACSLATIAVLGELHAVTDAAGGVFLVWNE